ncbi:MAG: tRNA uridine-5-carboxymethylaminomethyl(34) synthesis GTPase MnmE, partial [Alphaproteobacteria bacterium]|nr:tRNA uridine-5-carboxymethylaminomethyl(34) synthesis GTPase MnmE [Alphaproteobacteria bacterium]
MNSDTIFAPATAPGRAGIAVVRVSGPAAGDSLCALTGKPAPGERTMVMRTLRDPVSRETIDHALVLTFSAPASFTGENVVEYHLHGSPAVLKGLLAALGAQTDHRLAQPGEFTRRAFENGKMDLTAAEAVADLINAETAVQKAQALAQMDGALARLYDGWCARLTRGLAHLEADLDFPDEDLPEGVAAQIRSDLAALLSEIAAHMDDNRRGERLRDGVHIAVIGEPNAGKSSLVNALARRDVAIVSPEAGTTRDIIEVHMDLNGYPVILADTAGLRPSQIGEDGQEGIESEGIRRAIQRAKDADIKLLVFNGAQLPDLNMYTLEMADDNAIVAINKMDVYDGTIPTINGQKPVALSVRNGEGLDKLLKILGEKTASLIGRRETPSLTRARHREALEDCREALTRALTQTMSELMAEDVRLAVRGLGRITGRV